MNRGYLTTLIMVLTGANVCIAGDSCSQPRNCGRPVGCYGPKQDDSESGPIEPTGTFVPGPARGEVAGESNSLGLRLGTLRIPEISLALPTIQLPSLVRFRRDAQMLTDSGTAPFVRGEVNEFGLEPRDDSESSKDSTSESTRDNHGVAPCPPSYCPQPCYPLQQPCGDGCTRLFRSSSDGWNDAQSQEFAAKQQQVARLEAQVSELNQLVEKLVLEKSGGTEKTSVTGNLRQKSRPVDPWGPRPSAPEVCEEGGSDEDRQAQQIAALQAQIEQLRDAQQSRIIQSSLEEVHSEESEEPNSTRAVQEKTISGQSNRRSMLERLGIAIHRR